MNKATLTFGDRTLELTYYAQYTITLHDRSNNTMYVSHSAGVGYVSTGRFLSWALLNKAWTAGTYAPETNEFAETLRNHTGLSFRIEAIKEVELFADVAVSVGKPKPFKFVEIRFTFEWTDAKGKAHSHARDMPFIVISQEDFEYK